ncbi:hypothetical protein CcaCcLH18_13953 [Colletotrichum camelliae]|nr:hypothetical protein CcaCcLH18_13953 [Colletotrichum camelliae]
MRPRKRFASAARKATIEATIAHENEMTDNSATAGPQAQSASDHGTELRGPTHRGHPNAEESASVNPASTHSEELDASTGSTEGFLRLTPTSPCTRTGSETSRGVSPSRSSSDPLDLNATPGSLLEDQMRSGPMLENSPNNAADTAVSILADALLDFGLHWGRRIGRLEGSKILVETKMEDLRAEMDKAWSTIGQGRTCGIGFDEIESDLKQLVELKTGIDKDVQDTENEVRTYRLGFIGQIKAATRLLA